MITIKQIAELAGVSRTTVSRVLNDSGYVGEDARRRVLHVIEETGYVPNEFAKSLRTKKTKVIGVILPKIGTETSSRVMNGMDAIFAKEGYQILLASSNLDPDQEIAFLKLLKSRNADGIILSATNVNDRLAAEIHALDIPFIAVGQELPGVSSVVLDDFNAARDLTEHMIKNGRRKIGFIGAPVTDPSVGVLRKEGYLSALKENGLEINEAWIRTAAFNVESGYEAAKEILGIETGRPDAILAVTDKLAIGAMKYMKEIGIRLPADIAIGGMGASEMSEYVSPSLTTIDFQYEQIGEKAARLLLKKINGERADEKNYMLEYRLIARNSI